MSIRPGDLQSVTSHLMHAQGSETFLGMYHRGFDHKAHRIRLPLANCTRTSLTQPLEIDVVFTAITPGERKLVADDNMLKKGKRGHEIKLFKARFGNQKSQSPHAQW